jgi:hypothetical protein
LFDFRPGASIFRGAGVFPRCLFALVGGALVGGALVGGALVGGALVGGALVGGALVGGALVGGALVWWCDPFELLVSVLIFLT